MAPEQGDFDDLALWGDSATTHLWAGQADLTLEGVFFTPLAQAEYAGTSGQNQIHAQFVAYRLHARGQGFLVVAPGLGRTVEFPFSDFSTYRNLHFFSEAKCLHCGDHTAEDADIACGDIWRRKMRSEKIKHSIIVSRNPQASEMLEGMRDDGSLEIQEGTPEDAFLANRRAIVEHKNLYLRSVLGKGLGYKVEKPEKGMPIRWNDILSTYIYLINDKISSSPRAKKLIWLVPKPILKLYLYFFKFLTHI
ncbi:Coenzyme F420 hydrogenase/dehydrogenase, beta subunit C-terminal domain [Candidatus Sumerlaeota bacterium]|nr:Coenzyme F420 hydrogenase/dehydrogenase, beta subunit C-terminal domain [Candidatus Sumerlaeota bacterium]